jgi:hypothetical protein
MRRRKATVELFEEIRREYEFGIGTSQGVARKFGVHRWLVREALEGAVPQERPAPPRPQPRLGPVAPFIEAILAAARQAPRQQRHTAHRIYERIRAESPDCPVAEPTGRRYVGQRKAALGRWPASFDRFWEGLIARQGRPAGTTAMVELLQLGRPYGHARRRAASEAALALGCAAGSTRGRGPRAVRAASPGPHAL